MSCYKSMIRTHCVICKNSEPIKEFHRLKDYPITPSSSGLGPESDEVQDCIFATCNACGTVQLQNLIDPIKLYENSHNSTENTPTWKEHHRLFSEFISTNADTSKVLEVGGNSGVLYTLLKDRFPVYTILDICDSKKRPTTVQFLQGNCEDYDFTGHSHVILSHTFEHLYHPRKFIENLAKAAVHSVYISIPNMEHLYRSKNISIIHNEHTFFIGDNELRSLFAQHNYFCSSFTLFKQHSQFYHFVLSTKPITTSLLMNKRHIEILQFLSEFEQRIQQINLDKPTFICPAGHYGQKIYYYLRQFYPHIKGFIDNDPLKQGLRVYGTPCTVYPPDILSQHYDEPISCILYAGPYSQELQAQLKHIHPRLEILEISVA